MAHVTKFTTPKVTAILPKSIEFTPQGIVTKYSITYKGVHPDSELVIRDSDIRYTGAILDAIASELDRLGFVLKDAS